MIKNLSILAVIPARGGSKGVKLKNLRLVGGVPLVVIAGKVAHAVTLIDKCVVSTDSKEILEVAGRASIEVPFLRPNNLSGDQVGDWDVLYHALQAMEKIDKKEYDIVVMLQPTSPLRTPENVSKVIEKLVSGGYDSVWSVSLTDLKYHPLKQLVITDEGNLGYFDAAGEGIVARQQLKNVYHRNGVAYAFTRDCILNQKKIMGRRSGVCVISSKQISIDTEDDIKEVEKYLENFPWVD